MNAPTSFIPTCPSDFVGPAKIVAEKLMRKVERLKACPDQPLKLLISGPPGIGKTSLVNLIARALTTHPCSVEDVNGRYLSLDLVRQWTNNLAFMPMFDPWTVKVVNELDRCSKDVQDVLLTTLDRMSPGHAFLGTTNMDLDCLTERFQTRFLAVKLQPPDSASIASFLAARWEAPTDITRAIAECSCGNVRAALGDLELWMC
jgi:replication-associated recombination protein RarA